MATDDLGHTDTRLTQVIALVENGGSTGLMSVKQVADALDRENAGV